MLVIERSVTDIGWPLILGVQVPTTYGLNIPLLECTMSWVAGASRFEADTEFLLVNRKG